MYYARRIINNFLKDKDEAFSRYLILKAYVPDLKYLQVVNSFDDDEWKFRGEFLEIFSRNFARFLFT